MSEHTPSMPLEVDRNDMQKGIPATKLCMICGTKLVNQSIQDYYTCQECGFESTEFTREI